MSYTDPSVEFKELITEFKKYLEDKYKGYSVEFKNNIGPYDWEPRIHILLNGVEIIQLKGSIFMDWMRYHIKGADGKLIKMRDELNAAFDNEFKIKLENGELNER